MGATPLGMMGVGPAEKAGPEEGEGGKGKAGREEARGVKAWMV